jgi:hypothetical protein
MFVMRRTNVTHSQRSVTQHSHSRDNPSRVLAFPRHYFNFTFFSNTPQISNSFRADARPAALHHPHGDADVASVTSLESRGCAAVKVAGSLKDKPI